MVKHGSPCGTVRENRLLSAIASECWTGDAARVPANRASKWPDCQEGATEPQGEPVGGHGVLFKLGSGSSVTCCEAVYGLLRRVL